MAETDHFYLSFIHYCIKRFQIIQGKTANPKVKCIYKDRRISEFAEKRRRIVRSACNSTEIILLKFAKIFKQK
jgi:hypothetical protein